MKRWQLLFLVSVIFSVSGMFFTSFAIGQQVQHPDLTISKCTFMPANPTPADPVMIQVEIKNQGDAQGVIPNGATQWIASKPTGGGVGTGSKGEAIRPGSTVSSSLRLINPGELKPGTYQIKVTVDPENRVAESNEKNNQITFNLTITAASGGASQQAVRSSLASQLPAIRSQAVFSVFGPNSVQVVPGGNPVTLDLRGKNLNQISSAVVMQSGKPVREIEATLGPRVSSTQRQITFKAKPGAKLASGYTMQVVVNQKSLTLPATVIVVNATRVEAMRARMEQFAGLGKGQQGQQPGQQQGQQPGKESGKGQPGPGSIGSMTKGQTFEDQLGRLQDPISKAAGKGKIPQASPTSPGSIGQGLGDQGLGGLTLDGGKPSQADLKEAGTGQSLSQGGRRSGDPRLMEGGTSAHVTSMTDTTDSSGKQSVSSVEFHLGADGSRTTCTTNHEGGHTTQSVRVESKDGKVQESNSVDGQEQGGTQTAGTGQGTSGTGQGSTGSTPPQDPQTTTPHPDRGGGYSPSKVVVPYDPSRKKSEELHTSKPSPVDPDRESGTSPKRDPSAAKGTFSGAKPSKGDIDPRPDSSSGTSGSSVPRPGTGTKPHTTADDVETLKDPGKLESGTTPLRGTIPRRTDSSPPSGGGTPEPTGQGTKPSN
jgi:hypothetical protein